MIVQYNESSTVLKILVNKCTKKKSKKENQVSQNLNNTKQLKYSYIVVLLLIIIKYETNGLTAFLLYT